MIRWTTGKWIAGFALVAAAGLAVLTAPAEQASRHAQQSRQRHAATVWRSFTNTPLRFEPNVGQSDARVDYLARGPRYAIFLTRHGAVLSLRKQAGGERDVVRMRLVEPKAAIAVDAEQRLEGESHYLIGNDATAWRTGVPAFAKVRYRDVYPGVDLVYYGHGQRLEYDFVVAPGSDPKIIQLLFDGADSMTLERSGELSLALRGGTLRQHRPLIYQVGGQGREEVEGGYKLLAQNRVGFEIGGYDRSRPLIIDPVVRYSTYLGGGSDDVGNSIAVDSSGNAYVTGVTESGDFPAESGALLEDSRGAEDAFVTKFNAAGSGLVFSTFLGGSGDDIGNGVAVDGSGFVYVAGLTQSDNFFVTNDANVRSFQGGGSDCFVTKLTPGGGAAVFSTYLGAGDRDRCSGIAVDAAGNAHVSGVTESDQFPRTPGAFRPERDGGEDGFVTKYNVSGAMLFSLFLSGGGDDGAEALTLDANGNVYVTGYTKSDQFPVTANAQQTQRSDDRDAFVSKLSPDGTSLLYSTFLGGNNDDTGRGIALGKDGGIFVAGITESFNFPTSTNAFQRFFFGGSSDAFLAKYDAQGRGIFSTYVGGEGGDSANGVVVDSLGNATIAGVTRSLFFPVVAGSGQEFFGGGATDAYVTQVNRTGSNLLDSTFLGGGDDDEAQGIAIDTLGRVYVTGFTRSNSFLLTEGAFRTTRDGVEAFVTKFGVSTFAVVSAGAPGLPELGTAPESLASGFGGGWTGEAPAPPGQPLPPELAGVRVQITDSAGFPFTAPLLVVVAGQQPQINFLVPAGLALGPAVVEVTQNGVVISRGIVEIGSVAPAIFTANANGEGVPAATALRVTGDGIVSEQFVFSNAPLGARAPVPINLGPESDQVFLILFGTGIRKATNVTANVGGVTISNGLFFGAQSQFAGLDQVNIPLPRTLIGRGVVNVFLTVDGQVSNTVLISIL